MTQWTPPSGNPDGTPTPQAADQQRPAPGDQQQPAQQWQREQRPGTGWGQPPHPATGGQPPRPGTGAMQPPQQPWPGTGGQPPGNQAWPQQGQPPRPGEHPQGGDQPRHRAPGPAQPQQQQNPAQPHHHGPQPGQQNPQTGWHNREAGQPSAQPGQQNPPAGPQGSQAAQQGSQSGQQGSQPGQQNPPAGQWNQQQAGAESRQPQSPQAPPPAGAPWPSDLPPVAPRQPGVLPDTALNPDDPQPTSVLGMHSLTQSIVPPKPVEEDKHHLAPTTSGPVTGSSSFPGTGRRTASRASGRGRLGAGLVDVPIVPVKDPASAVLDDPVVAENKRFCNNCEAQVGRGVDGEPGAAEGECPTCGQAFNFRPRLFRGDLVGGQYEVLGSIAYGGLGWIYLAKDHNVSDRWVVLKGMIDTGDATSMASAVAERRFLAEVEHPNVVKIYNFVQHPDPHTGTEVGYIVMEYVGGQSLRQLALEHHREAGRAEPLPIGQVIAYGLEILPAIGYLHSIDMLYCDLKPDNVIQHGEQLKLIDLGAVRKTDDYESPLFFTSGYSAPELATEGATVASDIYTVGRTLAVLSIEFAGYTNRFKHTLPGPDTEPLFALFGSYYRVLKRATHEDPAQRFASAEDMADQLTGVLREVMALGTGRPRPGMSTVFGVETRTFGTGASGVESMPVPTPAEIVAVLPSPLVDTDDAAAAVLASITATEPAELIAALTAAPQDSIEVRLRLVKARIEQGDLRAASSELDAARRLATDPADWRPYWYRGLIALAGRAPKIAREAFGEVYDAVPGEIAPKLALAVSAELDGDHFAAARFYELVWRTDQSYVSAAFGLARVYLAQGARTGAIEVLHSVPDTSSHHIAAQVAAIKIKTRPASQGHVIETDLHDAAKRLEQLALDAERRAQLSAEVLEAAYGWVKAGKPGGHPTGGVRNVLGCDMAERELQFGLERCYRALARLAATPEQRHALVDKANAIRPRTLT